MADDTICAVATATGGGIGVVRVSGPRAEAIARGLLSSWPEDAESHRLQHGWARHPSTGEVLDEVLAVLMRAPRSYTGETVLELHAHGGAANLARLVEAVVSLGARVAAPGEFTRRAFLAGRIDLTRAEAVAELIAARSERAVRVAQSHLRGAVAERVDALAAELVSVLAEVEGRIDFPDEKLDFVPAGELALRVASLASSTRALAASYRRGRVLVEGLDVVLVGRSNAGKSSLLNAIAGEQRALVDEAPGTTRDFVECEVDLEGLRALLVDTAGERSAADGPAATVERRGIELGRRRRVRADVVVLVVDGEAGVGEVEERIAAERREATVVLWNKCDLVEAPPSLPSLGVVPHATSALTGQGIAELRALLRRRHEVAGDDAEVTLTSERQRALLDEAAAALEVAGPALGEDAPPELAAVDLRVAVDRLGQVTGRSVGVAVLDEIFARFCLGK